MEASSVRWTGNERTVGVAAAAAAVLALVPMNFGNLVESSGEDGGWAAFAVGAGIALLVAAVVYAYVVPRALAAEPARRRRTALIMGVLALLSIVAFWLGLGLVLGPAAILLGLAADARAPVALGAIACVLTIAAALFA